MTAPLQFAHLGRGHHRLACPQCAIHKQRRRDTALSVDVDVNGAIYLCHRCGFAGRWNHDGERSRFVSRPTSVAKPEQRLSLASSWRQFWRSLPPGVAGTAAEYLRARNCASPPADGDLRSTERLRHPSGYVGPALVALVSDAITSEPLTLHRTWVRGEGKKADVEPPRLLLGSHRKAGGVIRLCPDESVTSALAIAEGIETALAVATVYTPIWSALDAGNLSAFPVLAGIEELLIVADHDDAGISAARECAKRWQRAGRRVRIAVPPEPGTDACDLARAA